MKDSEQEFDEAKALMQSYLDAAWYRGFWTATAIYVAVSSLAFAVNFACVFVRYAGGW